MKDFDYYSDRNVKAEYPDRRGYKKKLIEEIDNTPMTTDQRTAAMSKVEQRVREWFNEAVKPYYKERNRLAEEFWKDAREELGYDQYLNDDGVRALEAKAWEDGHSAGFSEVFCHLQELESFVEDIIKRGMRQQNNGTC